MSIQEELKEIINNEVLVEIEDHIDDIFEIIGKDLRGFFSLILPLIMDEIVMGYSC